MVEDRLRSQAVIRGTENGDLLREQGDWEQQQRQQEGAHDKRIVVARE